MSMLQIPFPNPRRVKIDEMAIVQRLRGDQQTFAVVAETLLCRVLNEGDDYRDESIENAEWENRGEG